MKSFVYLYEGIKSNLTIGISIPVTDIFFSNIYLSIFLCIEWCWKLTYLICKTPLPAGFWLDSAHEVWQLQRCVLESPSKEPCKEHSWLLVSSCATWEPIIGSQQGHTFPGLLLVSDWTWQEYYSLAFWSIVDSVQWATFCLRAPNWPSQDIFKTMLKYPSYSTFLPSYLLFFHACPKVTIVWKSITIYFSAPSLFALEKCFPQNFLHIGLHLEVYFLEEGTLGKGRLKEGRSYLFFSALASEVLKEGNVDICGF